MKPLDEILKAYRDEKAYFDPIQCEAKRIYDQVARHEVSNTLMVKFPASLSEKYGYTDSDSSEFCCQLIAELEFRGLTVVILDSGDYGVY